MMIVGLAACQSSDVSQESRAKSVEAPRSTGPLDPQSSTRQAVLATYHGMWQDFRHAGRTADWDHPDLDDHATGDAEVVLRHGLYLAHTKDQVLKGEPRLQPSVSELKAKSATIVDCVDDTAFLIYGGNGKPVKGGDPTGRHRTTAGLVFHDDSWYVTTFVFREAGTC
ncbi:hypothetical protein [Streptosporangium sp. KLBMP 9127]|nr:hypothetical protein [Streptosporangium sp. KLBMP 9127]